MERSWGPTMSPDSQLRELNERLKRLASVIYTLSERARDDKHAPVTYRLLSDNLYTVWKRHARTLAPVGSIADEVAQELGYAALAVYSVGKRTEREAYVVSARLIGEMLSDWYLAPQPPPQRK